MKNLRTTDRVILVVSLLLASAIWLVSNLSKKYSNVISVPVVASCNIEGRSDVSANAVVTAARCRTTGFSLLRASFHMDRPVTVPFHRADLRHKGGDEYFIAGSMLNSYVEQFFGDGTELEGFITDSLVFRFPKVLHKKVPVEFVHTFSFRPQYMGVGTLRVEPDSVTVYADEARLDHIDRVYTAPLYLNDIHSQVHGVRKISGISGVRLSDNEVDYFMDVSRYVEVRVSRPVEVAKAPAGKRLKVLPSTAEVVLDCVFPLGTDPSEGVSLRIDYADFAASRTGKCIPRLSGAGASVIGWRVEPEVFDCIELQ